MADVFSAIILDTDYWDGTISWAGETTEGNRDSKYGARRFTSVSAWEADRDGNSQGGDDEYGIIIGPWASADTTQCYMRTWGADNVIIECPLTLPDGDNAAAHDGIYGNKVNAYKNEYSGGRNFWLYAENAKAIGVQVKNDTSSLAGISYRGNEYMFHIQRCIVEASAASADGINDVSAISCTAYIENCVVTAARLGIDLINGTTAGHIINCTSDGLNANDAVRAQVAIKVRNVAAFNSNDDFDTVTDVSYCASDDGDGTNAVDWDAEATDWAANFNAYGSYDYTPLDADLPSAGVGPGTDGDVPTTDIIGNSRSGATCTIGAFEFQAVGGLSIPVARRRGR